MERKESLISFLRSEQPKEDKEDLRDFLKELDQEPPEELEMKRKLSLRSMLQEINSLDFDEVRSKKDVKKSPRISPSSSTTSTTTTSSTTNSSSSSSKHSIFKPKKSPRAPLNNNEN